MGNPRCRPKPAPDGHPEPDGAVSGFHGQETDVVDRRHGAIMPAPGQGNLEFPRQALIQRVSQQMVGNGLGIRRHVEDFPLAHAGQVTGRHVAHGIGARFSRGEPHFREFSHHRTDLLQWNKVELNVLPSGDVADAGGIGVGQFGEAAELVRRQAAEWNFDSHHLHVRLPLSIDAVLQPERLEQVHGGFPVLYPFHFIFKGFNFLLNFLRNGHGVNVRNSSETVGLHGVPPGCRCPVVSVGSCFIGSLATVKVAN